MQNYDHLTPNPNIILYFKKAISQQSKREGFYWQEPISQKEQEKSDTFLLGEAEFPGESWG